MPEGSIVFRKGRRRQRVSVADLFSSTNGSVRVTERSVFVGEEACAGALQKLARPTAHETIYWTVGHGETLPESYDVVTGMSDLVRDLKRDGYRLKTLDIAESPAIPTDCAVLVVAAAREPFSRLEQKRLQGYLEAGGRMMVLAVGVPNAGVNGLLADWGVKMLPFTVVSPRTLSGADVVVTDFAEHRITTPLKGGTMIFEGAAPLVPTEGRDPAGFTALAKTDESAWGETDVSVRPWTFDSATEPRGPAPHAHRRDRRRHVRLERLPRHARERQPRFLPQLCGLAGRPRHPRRRTHAWQRGGDRTRPRRVAEVRRVVGGADPPVRRHCEAVRDPPPLTRMDLI